MRVELDEREAWALLSKVMNAVLEEAPLADADRAALRRWRSEQMRVGAEAMRELTAALNQDLERALRAQERSLIQKHDWQ